MAVNKTVTCREISVNDSIRHKFINISVVTAPLGNNPVKCKCAHVLHVVGSIYVAAQRENSHHLHPLLGECTVKERKLYMPLEHVKDVANYWGCACKMNTDFWHCGCS